jgi:protein-S-isoprenylcysteine O-methyltransferase Ste14
VRLLLTLVYVAAWPALMLALAGDARWREGWIFAIWLVGLFVLITGWMYVKDPALLAERHQRRAAAETAAARSDRKAVLWLFAGFLAWIVVIPLDAKRFAWTPRLPLIVEWAGGALLAASAFLLFRAFHDNTFLSGQVRIQSDRRQVVVSDGVYALVRHPMYAGMVLMFTGVPLLCGSMLGLIAAAGIVLVLVRRIRSEEQLLLDELDGYADYQRTVRYRLFPLVW